METTHMAAKFKSLSRGTIGPTTFFEIGQIRLSGDTGAAYRFYGTHVSQSALDGYIPQTTPIGSKKN